MHISRLIVLAIPLLASSVAAQIPRLGPATTLWARTGATTTPIVGERYLQLAAPNFPSDPLQVELRNVTATTFQGAASLLFGVEEFGYDASTGAITTTANAASLNFSAAHSLSISEDGTVGAVDTTQGPHFAVRSSRGMAFGPATKIIWQSGFTGTFVGSKIHMEGGQYRYSWKTNSGDIAIGDFNPLAGASGPHVTNERTVIPQSVTGTTGSGLHSQHPITSEEPAGSGNHVLLGWIFSLSQGGPDSDTYYLPSADGTQSLTNQGAYPVMDTTGLQHRGTSIGNSGSLVVADFGRPPWHMPMIAINNAVVPAAGGTATVRILTEYDLNNVYQVCFCFGVGLGPLPLPFTIGNSLFPAGQTTPQIGQVGVTLVPAIATLVTPTNPGGVSLTFTAPPLPPGSVAAMQAIAIKTWNGPPAAGHTAIEVFTGNTAVIEWQ